MVELDKTLVNHALADNGTSLLHFATLYNSVEVVKYLVSQVRDITVKHGLNLP